MVDQRRLNSIKARLGSLSPVATDRLPPAARRLITEDLPWLIELVEMDADEERRHAETP